MPIEDWADMLRDRVTYQPVASRNDYGKPAYGTEQTFRARVNYRSSRVASRSSGQDEIADGEIWLLGVIATMSMDDRFTLPDGSTPNIINWDTLSDENGPHHTKVFFGRTSGVGAGRG